MQNLKTANQVKSEFELLASGHYQIHSFLYAQEFEQQAYENLIYPLMLVYPLGGSLSGTSYTRNYRVVIADRVLKSEGNELEVESDTQLIALDTLAYWMKLGTNERFSITSSNTITPFWEKWGDEVTGHFVDIGIEEFYDFNSCAIPLSSAIPSPSNPCKDARILINSVVYGNAPSDTNFNVVVKDQLGALVGSLIGGEWIVNTGGACADANYTIEDSLGNVLYTGTIPSGGSVTEVISNSTLNVNKSDGTLISSRSILAEGTDSYNVGDSSAVLKDEDGNVLSTTPIKATESKDIVAPNGDVSVNSVAFDDVLSGGTLNIQVRKSTGNDLIGSKQGQYWRIGNSTAVIKDSANNTLKSEAIMATESENIVINNSLVNVRKSDNVLINAVSVKAENTENYLVADSTITNAAVSPTYTQLVKATEGLILPTQSIQNNGVASGFIPSVGTINVTTNAAPTSFTITGRTIDIVVPTGSTPMDVDFSADKLVAYIGETITFTDLSDQSPTHWSWRFSDGTNSIVQNPTKSFNTSGFFNVILLAGKVGAGGVNIKNSYIEINELFFTEIFGIPNALFSLRKLSPNTTYSGAAIRVRRSSDNTEQDIGFVSSSANAGLDTTALLSFVGAGNGFVVTWYNQNGSGNHATQSTAANQPQIVTSGVVELSSSLPTIKLDGSNDFLLFSSVFTSTINLTTFAITQSAAVSTNQYIYDNSNDGASGGGYAFRYLNSGGFRAWAQNANSNASGGSTTNNVPVLLSQLSRLTGGTTENNEIWVNNASVGTNSGGTGVRNAKTTTRFGHSELLEGFLNGKISEIIAFDTYKSTDRAAITTNINSYYNVF
jgi:PKD repeat protein